MKAEEVWSARGAIMGTAAGIMLVGLGLLLTIGISGNDLLGNYERFVMYVVGAPAGSYIFGHVLPRTQLARSEKALARYDLSKSRSSRRFFLTVTSLCIAYAAFVLATTPSHL